jgi:hypothetical protein
VWGDERGEGGVAAEHGAELHVLGLLEVEEAKGRSAQRKECEEDVVGILFADVPIAQREAACNANM